MEGSSDTHMEGNFHPSVVSCFLCIVDIFFPIFACSQYILAPVGGVLCH